MTTTIYIPEMTDAQKRRFWRRVNKIKGGCWEFQGARSGGRYGAFRLKKFGPTLGAHRISYVLSNGPIPEGQYVFHKCDNPACVNPEHLFLGTAKQNWEDAVQKRRISPAKPALGIRNPGSKLTEAQVIEIRSLRGSGEQTKRLAARFGVSKSAITEITTRRTWTHI